MPVAISIQWKPLRDSHYVVASLQPRGGGLRQIFAQQSTLREIQTIARGDPEKPIVGLLLGERLDCSLTLIPYVLITSHVEVALASLDERAVTEAVQTLRARIGGRNAPEVLGWYCTSRSTEASVSRVHAAVHAACFEERWQTALIFGNGGNYGAFFLYDLSAARWFHAPFFEVGDSKKAGSLAAKPTCVAWPAYLTTASVVPLAEVPRPAPVSPPGAFITRPVSAPTRQQPAGLPRPVVIARPTPTRDAIAIVGRAAAAAPRSAVDFVRTLGGRVVAKWEASAAQRKAEADAERKREDERRAREEARRAKEAAARRAAREEAQRHAAEAEKERAALAAVREAEETEARRKAAEEAERLRAGEAELKRRAAEAEAKRRAQQAEAQRQAAEAEAKRRAEEEELKRQAAAADAKRRKEAAAAERQAAEAEAKRRAEVAELKRQAEAAEAKRREEEAELKRQAAVAETKRREEEAAARRVVEAELQRKAAEEAQRKAAEMEARRKAAEEEKRKAAAEAWRRAAEVEAARQAAELEARRQAAEAEARRVAEAKAEAQRRAAEAEARRVTEAEAKRVAVEAEAQAKRVAAEAEAQAKRVAAEAEARRFAEKAEADARLRQAQAEEEARKKAAAAEEETQRKAAAAEAEAQRKAAEAEAEAERKALEAEQDARRLAAIAEAEARRKAVEAQENARRKAAEAEALRISVEVAAIRERLARAPIEGSRHGVPRVASPQMADLEDTTASDGPYRYLAFARREGFEVSERIERGTAEEPETVWLLYEKESGLRLIVVTTDEVVREASLHYNLRTDDESLLRITAPEHRDLASRTIYGREECLHDLRARCRRLRGTGTLQRDWRVTPTFQHSVATR